MNTQFLQSAPGAEPFRVESYFAAAPERVFAAWTRPEAVMKWFGKAPNSLVSADIDLRPGGIWRFVMSRDDDRSIGFEGQYLEIEPAKKLVFSWAHVVEHANGEREATPYSRVEVTFSPKGAGTDLRLVHSAVRSEDARRGIGGGWEAAFTHLQGVLDAAQNAAQ